MAALIVPADFPEMSRNIPKRPAGRSRFSRSPFRGTGNGTGNGKRERDEGMGAGGLLARPSPSRKKGGAL